MTDKLLLDEYQRKYYDVEIQYQCVVTVDKRIYVDEMAQFVETYYDCDWLDSKGIICEEIGEDDFHNNNQLFAEMVAPDRVEDEELHHGLEITDTFVASSTEGSEREGKEIWKCVICKEHFTGFGNNPDPVKPDGDCCDACNTNHVIPARMSELFNEQQNNFNENMK